MQIFPNQYYHCHYLLFESSLSVFAKVRSQITCNCWLSAVFLSNRASMSWNGLIPRIFLLPRRICVGNPSALQPLSFGCFPFTIVISLKNLTNHWACSGFNVVKRSLASTPSIFTPSSSCFKIWKYFLVSDNIFFLVLLFYCLRNRQHSLREGYAVKFFFQGISWNTNLTSIKLFFNAFMKHFSERNF